MNRFPDIISYHIKCTYNEFFTGEGRKLLIVEICIIYTVVGLLFNSEFNYFFRVLQVRENAPNNNGEWNLFYLYYIIFILVFTMHYKLIINSYPILIHITRDHWNNNPSKY